jgi:AbrB family transcriptional regulator (stage V sporulation protein T)
MKATGIVRRIDDLGRVVIPKEIRRTLRIREGDPLEIFTDREGEIILKKYSPIGELGTFARDFADTLSQTSGHITCIVDKDQIIAVSGGSKKEFLDKNISSDLEKAINQRNTVSATRADAAFVPVLEDDTPDSYNNEYIAPIISEGDVLGAVILLSPDKKMGEVESKLATNAANFLGKQMEQ